ncbi:organic hydroperoxide resistance protein [Acinetobacter rudis]|uniref:organic hydroperoxide resistance protein n=1 Tax=Acinetobacter rudis TaxID=632955 RepID=UPI0033421F0F
MKIFYKTRATATGGRAGHTQLDDGTLALDLAVPGSGKEGTNPEQLFALGYAACFDNALPFAAKQLDMEYSSSKTSVEVGIGILSSGGYALDIDLYIEITGLSQEDAEKLVAATHKTCPYSNATRGNVDVRLHTTVA